MSWFAGVILALQLWAGQAGIVKFYQPGTFALVARNRGMALAWDQVDGFAAVANCRYVDAARPWVVLAAVDGGPVEGYQVVDCAAPRDRARHAAEGLILEIDYASALRQLRRGRLTFVRHGHAPVRILGYRRLAR